jgi:hypothetical protein
MLLADGGGICGPASPRVHKIASHYRKGARLGTHMHREAQLVYAACGTLPHYRRAAKTPTEFAQ